MLPATLASSPPISVAAPRGISPMPEAPPLLDIRGLFASYGDAVILRGIDLSVGEGEIVAVIGANGAGKTTLNRTISGVIAAGGGTISFAGERIDRSSAATIVGRGLVQVPEGRRI